MTSSMTIPEIDEESEKPVLTQRQKKKLELDARLEVEQMMDRSGFKIYKHSGTYFLHYFNREG